MPKTSLKENGTGEYFTAGSLINERFLVKELKGGGAGCIYICFDQLQKKPCVLKTVQRRWFRDDSFYNNFVKEAMRWILLPPHPNVVYAYGIELAARIPHIVLEYVPPHHEYGSTLADAIKKRGADWRAALRFGLQISRGMHSIHSEGKLFHRDLKPENVLVNARGDAKITDFGIAARPGDAEDDFGTSAYMAPERWEKRALDARSDIYSAGLILYELAAGKHPFHGGEGREWFRHCCVTIQPPDPRQIESQIPEPVSTCILSCLTKDRESRPADFGVLHMHLRDLHHRLLGDIPDGAGMPDLPQQGEVWTNLTNSLLNIGRRAEALAAAVEGVEKYPDDVNIRISLGVALLSNGRPKEAIVEYNRAHTLSPKYFLPIVNLASAYSLVGEAEEARKWARLAMDRTDGSYNLLPLVPALSNIGDHAAAAELSEQIIKRDPSSAVAWNNHAVVLRRKRDLTEALECSARALQLNPRYAAAWCNRAVALISLSRYPEALEAAENALEIDPSMSNARGVLSKALSQMDRADEAVNILEDAVREFPDDTTNWTNLAVSYATIGRRADALSAVDEALRIDPRLSAAMKLKEHLLADI